MSSRPWLTVQEVAETLHVSNMTVYRLCHIDAIRHIRVGRSYRISAEGLRRYIADGGNDEDVAR